jgi:hypothetical protein
MRLKATIIFVIMVLGTSHAFAQQLILPQGLEEIIEEIASNEEEDIDLSVIIEDLYFIWENPLDLNTATQEDLGRIYLLNEFQINNLLNYVKIFGPVNSIYELRYIEGFTEELVIKVSPFFTIGQRLPEMQLSTRNVLKYGKHHVYSRVQRVLEEQKGYTAISDSALAASPNSRYLGSPFKIYNRYLFSYRNRVFWGITAEKDAGEEFFSGTNPNGYDYYSAHFFLRGSGKVKKIALGDFHVRFGQGLVLWPGFSTGKSIDVMNIKKNPRGLVRYTSTDENMFLRGAGTTVGIGKKTELSVFFSSKRIDASVSKRDSITNEITEVSSLQTTGLHATPSQTGNKNVLGEMMAGANISWKGNTFRIGMTGLYYHYAAPLVPAERVYNQFEFSGKRNYNAGIDYQLNFRNLHFFGEGAVSRSGGNAFLNGLLANAGPRVSFAALYRSYYRDYHAYFSNAFGENTRNINENGFYTGIVLLPYPGWKISAYYDIFAFNWIRFGAYTPTTGSDYLVQAEFNPSGNVSMNFRIKQKNKLLNSPVQEPLIRQTEEVINTGYRYQINYRVLPALELRNRLEYVVFKKESSSPENGFLIYQDVIYRAAKIPLSLSCRYAIFETDSYNARMYAYENDVLYAFSVPAYYDKGMRTYLVVSYSFPIGLDVWFRIAQTHLPKRKTIGSDLNEINGNSRTEVKLQVRFTY